MRDLHNNIAFVEAIAPAVYAADTTPASLDLAGFNSAEIVIQAGAGGISFTSTNKIEFSLTHSDDNATFTPVTAADLLGLNSVTGGVILAFTAAKAATSVHKVGYVGGRRYLKLLADFSGTHGTGTALSAILVKAHAASRPVS